MADDFRVDINWHEWGRALRRRCKTHKHHDAGVALITHVDIGQVRAGLKGRRVRAESYVALCQWASIHPARYLYTES